MIPVAVRRGRTKEVGLSPALAYAQIGTGRDVVLIHGATTTLEDMTSALFGRVGDDLRLTAFDRPGHGGSGAVGVSGSPWRQAEALHTAARELGLRRPVVVGHSFGGAVAMAYALQYPTETAGVVALAPMAFPEMRPLQALSSLKALPGFGAWLNAVLAPLDAVALAVLWRKMFLPQAAPQDFLDAFPAEVAAGRSQCRAEGEDGALLDLGLWRGVLNYPRCAVPVRVLAGDLDTVVNNALQGLVLAGIVPDGDFEALPGLGHMVHHFAQSRVEATIRSLSALATPVEGEG